ncbi:hypothetical protein [Scytonema sp. PCC 10023]
MKRSVLGAASTEAMSEWLVVSSYWLMVSSYWEVKQRTTNNQQLTA